MKQSLCLLMEEIYYEVSIGCISVFSLPVIKISSQLFLTASVVSLFFFQQKRNVPNSILLPVSHYIGAAVVNPPVFSFQICNFLRFWQTTLTKVRMDRWPTPSGHRPWADCSRLTLSQEASQQLPSWTEKFGHRLSINSFGAHLCLIVAKYVLLLNK